jgi:hypothetical protein
MIVLVEIEQDVAVVQILHNLGSRQQLLGFFTRQRGVRAKKAQRRGNG